MCGCVVLGAVFACVSVFCYVSVWVSVGGFLSESDVFCSCAYFRPCTAQCVYVLSALVWVLLFPNVSLPDREWWFFLPSFLAQSGLCVTVSGFGGVYVR